jgi:hypothetical protein
MIAERAQFFEMTSECILCWMADKSRLEQADEAQQR